MSRGWENQDEKSYWIPDCDIEGKIPLDIHGSLIRNGPGINEVYGKKLKHPIDGDGMVCKLTLYDGKVHFHSKFVSSFHRKVEAKEKTFIFPGQMGTRIHSIAADTLNAFKAVFYGSKPNLKFRNPSNTNSLYWGGKILTLYETSLPHCLDPYNLETLGLENLNNSLTLNCAGAHFRIDPISMNLIMFGLRVNLENAASLEIYEFDKQWTLINKLNYKIPGLNYAHDFLLFPDYFLFHMTPFTDVSKWTAFQILIGWTSPGESMHWYPDKPSMFVVIPRKGKSENIMFFKTDPCHIFHFATAEQNGDKLHFSSVCLSETMNMSFAQGLWLSNADVSPGQVYNFTIDLSKNECKRELIYNKSAEFPITHPYRHGESGSKYVYLMASDGEDNLPFRDVVKLDIKSLKKTVWNSDGIIGEPLFIPRHGYESNKKGSEDDGYIIVQLYHPDTHKTDFCIIDAQHVDDGPLARIKLKHHVPYGFHGTFTPEVFFYEPKLIFTKSKL
ncbi:apocarotenoid-15,15'-oxygenase isoform X1 [Hydra vulgaris]|uniref:Apocarotenoid-15,15'-oxygenase isoform X1 n=1 Tax=Hydra vulgaris TaxID=6087 RepID=A0ABM4CH48_HYDVU